MKNVRNIIFMSFLLAVTATGLHGMEFDETPPTEEVTNPNKKDEKGNTPLHTAIINRDTESFQALIDNPKTDLNIQNNYGDTPLMVAIVLNNIEIVQALLNNPKTNLNIQNNYGDIPLMVAIVLNNIEIVQALLNNPKTNLNIQDSFGQTPLQLAQRTNYEELIQLIEEAIKGRPPIREDLFALLPLEIQNEILKKLIDPNQRALEVITNLYKMREVKKKFRDAVDNLIAKKIIPNPKELRKYFKENPNNRMELKRKSFLHYLVERGKNENALGLLEILLKQEGTNPNIYAAYGETPLHTAIKANNTEIVKALLKNPKTNPTCITIIDEHYMMSPLELSKEFNADNEITISLKKDIKEFKERKVHLEKDNPNFQNKEGGTPLHIAARENNISTLKTLLNDVRTDPNIQDYNERTPLHEAIQRKNIDIIKTLLNNVRTDPNIQDFYGMTPLHYAVRINYLDAVKDLLDNPRTDLTIQNYYEEQTPLELAQELNREEIIELLEEAITERKRMAKKESVVTLTPDETFSASFPSEENVEEFEQEKLE